MSTRSDSHTKTLQDRPNRERMVLNAILTHPGITRSEIAKMTNLRLSTVCGRVTPLIKERMIEARGTKWDAETRRNVELLFPAAPDLSQASLF